MLNFYILDSDAFLSPPEESDDEQTIELEEQIQVQVQTQYSTRIMFSRSSFASAMLSRGEVIEKFCQT